MVNLCKFLHQDVCVVWRRILDSRFALICSIVPLMARLPAATELYT